MSAPDDTPNPNRRQMRIIAAVILSLTFFVSAPAQAQGIEEQASIAYADAYESLAQTREAWAFARDKQENMAILGDLVSASLGGDRDLSGQMLVEIDELRREAEQFLSISRDYRVRAPDLLYSQEEAHEHASHSQGRAAESRKDQLYAEDWVNETRRRRQKEYRQAAADASAKTAELFDKAYDLFTEIAGLRSDMTQERELSQEIYERAAQAQEELANAEERWARAEEEVAAAEEMWTRALEGDQSAQAKSRSAQARARAEEARERTAQWRERAAEAREGTLDWDQELSNDLRERAAQARQEMFASMGNAAVVQDSGGNSSISRLTVQAWQRASSAWENTSQAMESAADAWDSAIEAKERE